MAKKSKQKSKGSKKSAVDAAVKRARERAADLAAEAKSLRKSADKAEAKARKAEAKTLDARTAAGLPVPQPKPDETELLRLALRSTQAQLVDAEHRLAAAEQQVAGQQELQDDAADQVIEDAIVDAAVQETVVEAIAGAVAQAQSEDDDLDAILGPGAVSDAESAPEVEAELVEIVAVQLDEAAVAAEPAPEEPDHDGDAEEASTAFESTPADEPPLVATEATPPLPDAPADDAPNESWTLLRLRDEAKRRGLTGTSNLPKAKLLDRLRAS